MAHNFSKQLGIWFSQSRQFRRRDFGDMMAVFASSAPALAGALAADEGIIQ